MLRSDVVFVFQQLLCQCVGNGIWHFHKTGNATRHGCFCFCIDSCFMRKSWLPEMYLVIDTTGQEIFPFTINFSITGINPSNL